MLAEDGHNPGSGAAIPKWRTLVRTRGFLKNKSSGRKNAIRIHSHYVVRAVLNGGRPFRILTQGEARYAEDRGFLLDASGVGEDNAGPVAERKEIEISEGIERHDSDAVPRSFGQISQQTKTLDILPSARMDGEEDGKLGGQSAHCAENALQRFRIVHVGWPV